VEESTVEHPSFGILAGMGPQSTGAFVDLVVDECRRQYGARHDIDFPKMMICSQPAPFYEDRPTDHAALEAATLSGLRDLEATEVDFLAMACHTVHIYHPKLAARLRKPLLDMVEIAARALPPTATTVALIAARPTVESGIYQRALSSRGFVVVDSGWQEEVDGLLGLVRRPSGVDELSTAWRGLLARVAATGADLALVACLDLTGVLAHAQQTIPIVDAARSLAAEIVRTWLALRG
jgi:aspartate racemase